MGEGEGESEGASAEGLELLTCGTAVGDGRILETWDLALNTSAAGGAAKMPLTTESVTPSRHSIIHRQVCRGARPHAAISRLSEASEKKFTCSTLNCW